MRLAEEGTALRGAIKREEGGQVLVLVAVGMTAILGMAGFSIDVASWYQAHRKVQSVSRPRSF